MHQTLRHSKRNHHKYHTHHKHQTRKNGAWGYHLIVNAGACNPESIRSKSNITAFSKALVKGIDMVAYGAPRVVRFGSGNKQGYTLVQLIETSNITAHFCEETNDAYLDIFSCKPFRPHDAIQIIDEYFHPRRKQTTFLKRQA